MKYLLLALTLTLSAMTNAEEIYSEKATAKCQLFIELAAYGKGYSFESFKVRGASYVDRGHYSEFIVSVQNTLALVQCQTDYKGEIMFLKLGETVVVGF